MGRGRLFKLGRLIIGTTILLFSASIAVAQEYSEFGLASRFGPHLACSNSEEFIKKVRKAYGDSGWASNQWLPATVMVPIYSTDGEIEQIFTAMSDSSGGPKLWPIVRIYNDGNKISQGQIDDFIAKLGSLGTLESLEGKKIFVELGNEPNHAEEWSGSIDPRDYRGRLGDIIGVVRDFRVLNGALDQRAGNTGTTMEAVEFWDAGGLREIVGDLDGYAFNNYVFEEGEGRHSRSGWRVMRGLLEMDTGKPVFLTEYGLDPKRELTERMDFLAREFLEQDTPGSATYETTAVTPLVCLNGNEEDSCPQKATVIFQKGGGIDWFEEDESGNCAGEKKVVSKCGEAGDKDDEGAMECTEQKEDSDCPYQLQKEGKCGPDAEGNVRGLSTDDLAVLGISDPLCSGFISRVPIIGDFFKRVLCRWADAGDVLQEEGLPYGLQEGLGGVGERSGTRVRLQASLDIRGKLRELVAGKVSKDKGYLRAYFPATVAPPEDADPLDVHNRAAGCGGDFGVGALFMPHEVCEQVKKPEGPIPTPRPGEEEPPLPIVTQPPVVGGLHYYSQRDPAYSSHKLDGCTIGYAGCGPTTVAMILATYIESDPVYDPINVVDEFYPNAGCAGTSIDEARIILGNKRLETSGYLFVKRDDPQPTENVVDQMRNFMNEGDWQLFCGANFYWESKNQWIGHLFWVNRIDENNEIYVMDPYFGYGEPFPMSQSGLNPQYKYCFGFR